MSDAQKVLFLGATSDEFDEDTQEMMHDIEVWPPRSFEHMEQIRLRREARLARQRKRKDA